jgi:UDP-2,3-diacylglucosamine pyrophosphatase LpxH
MSLTLQRGRAGETEPSFSVIHRHQGKMPPVQRLIIADAHVGQRPGDAEAMTALVGSAVQAGIGELIYVGDAFQYLIGFEKFWTAAMHRVFGAWRETLAAGTNLVVIEGNRDFFLDATDFAPFHGWNGRRYEFEAGSVRFRLEHGDRVNKRDLQYRFWAWMSKSAVARFWARALPRRLAVAIVRSMEAKLARTNIRYRVRKPIAALEREAEAAWEAGVDVQLWGHFHSLWEHHREDKVAMVLPGWLENRVSVLVDDDGEMQWVDHGLTPCDVPTRMS